MVKDQERTILVTGATGTVGSEVVKNSHHQDDVLGEQFIQLLVLLLRTS
jgi:nucleoside-diphosphate-sugar epimerase